jgi:hypothetical protein
VVGDDLTCEVTARALSAGGVGCVRFVRRDAAPSDVVLRAIAESNPDARVETRAWPPAATAWLDVLAGASAIVRSGFDDDAMLRAAIRLGIPVVVVRAGRQGIDVLAFRRHGPCPHTALDVPEVVATTLDEDGGASVVAGQLVAAEVLMLLVGREATAGQGTSDSPARARHTRVPFDGGVPTTTDLPWTPECFACGGSGFEMTFA